MSNIKIILNGESLIVSSLSTTFRISNIDSVELVIADDLSRDYQSNNIFQIVENEVLLFSGYSGDIKLQNKDGRVLPNIPLVGKLDLLNRLTTGNQTTTNSNLLDLLNNSNTGIKFVDYNLSDPRVLPTWKSLNFKFANQTWFEFLADSAKKFGFFFWYDYQLDVCKLGIPNKKISITNNNLLGLETKTEIGGISYKKAGVLVNKIIVQGGGFTKLTLENTSSDIQALTGYTVKKDGDSFYIEDLQSQKNYGVYIKQFSSQNTTQNSSSPMDVIAASDILYNEAYNQLINGLEPVIQIENFKYYIESNKNQILTPANYFDVDINTDPNNSESQKVKGSFNILDITHNFTKDSSEDFYQCTLSTKNILPKTLDLLNQINLSNNKPAPALSNNNFPLNFTISVDNSGNLAESTQNFNLKFDEKIKKINKIYISGSSNVTLGGGTFFGTLRFDGVDLSEKIPFRIEGTDQINIPLSGKFDILSLDLNKDQINRLTNSKITHTLSMSNIGFAFQTALPAKANVNFTVEIEAEV